MQTKFILPLVLLLVVFGACTPSYMPNMTNAPLLYQQGDFTAGAHVGSGIELQGAYGVTDHVGVMANILAIPFSDDRTYYGEAGLGAYQVLSDKFHLELFSGGGIGYGKAFGTSIFSKDTISEEGKYTKFFIQPDLGYHHKIFEIALAVRFGYVGYYQFRENDVEVMPAPFGWLIEPALSLRFGFGGNGFFENKKLTLQFGLSSTLGREVEFENGSFMGGLGLIYRNRKYNTGFK